MEEDFNFRTLFLRNLHFTVSQHLGIMACPRTMTTRQLRDLAHKAYGKQRTASEKTVKNPVILLVSELYPELPLEGARQRHSERPFNRGSRDFTASQEWYGHEGARPKHQMGRAERSWSRPNSSDNQKGGGSWEPGNSQHRYTQSKVKPELPQKQSDTDTSESAEILRILKELIQKRPHKQDHEDKPDSLFISQTKDFGVQTISQTPTNQSLQVPESAVLTVSFPTEAQETSLNCLPINTTAPVPSLLGNLIERGEAKKLYLSITLENEVELEALVDTGADLTLMSSQLFTRLQNRAKAQNLTLKPQRCMVNVQSYSQTEVQLQQVIPIHLTLGPMSIIHPVYISPMDSYPLLIGKDLLDRFEPLMDFKQLKIWAQVREPLPFKSARSSEVNCQVTQVMDDPPASRGNFVSDLNSKSSLLCTLHPAKDSEPYPGLDAQIQQNVKDADAMQELQAFNIATQAMLNHLSDPSTYPITNSDMSAAPTRKRLNDVRHLLHIQHNILWYVPDDRTTPALVVPQAHRGVLLMHAHDTACAGHHRTKATYETLKQVAYWPEMQQDVAQYIKGCLVCCQFHPANPNQWAPPQKRGVNFPLSDLQIDWVGPLPRSTRGNKHFLTVICQFTKLVECFPAPNDTTQTTAYTAHQYLDELHLGTTFAFQTTKIWYYSFAPPIQTAHQQLSKKFLPHWTGPHEIVDKLSPVAYWIKMGRSQKEPIFRGVHRNQVKRHSTLWHDSRGGGLALTRPNSLYTASSLELCHLGNSR